MFQRPTLLFHQRFLAALSTAALLLGQLPPGALPFVAALPATMSVHVMDVEEEVVTLALLHKKSCKKRVLNKFLAKISYAWGFPCSFLQEDDLEYQIAGLCCLSVISNFVLNESRV